MANFYKPQPKKKIDKKHQEYAVVKLDHQGDGIAFVDNKPVFIEGALPNETVLAQLTESKKYFAKGKLMKVLSPSADRVAPFCPHYQDCGGCNLQHLAHDEQIVQKQQILQELMTRTAGIKDIEQQPAITGKPTQYRRRTRLSAKVSKQGKFELGFRKRASKDIINIEHCPVLNQELDAVLSKLYPLLDGLKGTRVLGHVELSTSDGGNVLFIRTIKPLHQNDIATLKLFASQQSLILFIKQADDEAELLVGSLPYYQLDGLNLYYQPQNFLQVNEEINQKMVSQAIDWLEIKPTDRVLDLFCGLGNFSLPLAKRAAHVVGIEGVESMVEQAGQNAELNALNNLEFFHANLELPISNTDWGQQQYQKILLDPARAGAFEVMEYLAKSKAERILYVSCNPATLARDSQILLKKGYRLDKLGLLDMFPNTGHLEAMALFTKA